MTPELRARAEIDRLLQAADSVLLVWVIRWRGVAPGCGETDFAPSRFGEPRQPANFREQLLNGCVMNHQFATMPVDGAREFVDTRGQVSICCERRPHAHKGANHQYTHCHGRRRTQNVRGHQTAVLSKSQRKTIYSPCASQCSCKLQVHRLPFLQRQPECEIRRKSPLITLNLLVQALGLDTVERGKVCIQNHPLTAQNDYAISDRLDIWQLLHHPSFQFGNPARTPHNC